MTETISQPSKPSRREPRRAVHVDYTPAADNSQETTEPTREPSVAEQSDHSRPVQNESPPRNRNLVCADSNSGTPFRRSSSQRPYTTGFKQAARPTVSTGRSRHTASHTPSHTSRVADPAPPKQTDIEKQIDMELEGVVFLDESFVQHFLSGDSERLAGVLEYCENSPGYGGGWSVPQGGPESVLYGPIVEVLNTIKRAVENGGHTHGNDDPDTNDDQQPELPPPVFLDHSAHAIPGDDSDCTLIKPDIVLFEGHHEHWESVRMAIEVKANSKSTREGMKQLSRYARVVYAHQLHRRHLYGLVICGPKVTFVRYDRAGVLHSPEIDMCKSSEEFTRAFASLLMLDRAAEGYDPAFSTTVNRYTRLDYYVDLPESALDDVPTEPDVAGPSRGPDPEGTTSPEAQLRSLPTRRFRVMERLCHRKSIRGRATIVLRIQEVSASDEATDEEKAKAKGNTKKRKADDMDGQKRPHYILKLIWRDPHRESEGDVMKILRGMFAVAQYVWHCDVAVDCVCGTGGSCKKCVDETPRPGNLKPSPVMGFTTTPPADGRATKSSSVANTAENASSGCVRTRRVYSRILMSSVGEPLWKAQSADEFLRAFLDAILGYWGLINLGILHRDISDGNVMMLRDPQSYPRRRWLEEREEDVEALRGQFGDMAESEAKLRKVLNNLNRDPTGMVTDFDLHTKHRSAPPTQGSTDDVTDSRQPREITPQLRSTVSSISHILRDQNPELPSKRLKASSNTSVRVTSACDSDITRVLKRYGRRRSRDAPINERKHPLVDFRTGTPTFMSVRVLLTKPGKHCPHSFVDDLESFFWLLFWSVAAHLDRDQNVATPNALNTLRKLDQDDMESIAGFKRIIFDECSDSEGDEIIERVLSFENDWAANPGIGWLVFQMGDYFASRSKDRPTPEPAVVFPEITDMISTALTLASTLNL